MLNSQLSSQDIENWKPKLRSTNNNSTIIQTAHAHFYLHKKKKKSQTHRGRNILSNKVLHNKLNFISVSHNNALIINTHLIKYQYNLEAKMGCSFDAQCRPMFWVRFQPKWSKTKMKNSCHWLKGKAIWNTFFKS